jgi:hypothetical protein
MNENEKRERERRRGLKARDGPEDRALSASLPQMLRNATVAAWLVRKRAMIHVMLRPSLVSMYTAKNGAARLTEKFHVPRNRRSLRKFTSRSGSAMAAPIPRALVLVMRGSGIRVRNPTPRNPVAAATASRIVYTPISGVTRAPYASTPIPASRLTAAPTATAADSRFPKYRPRTLSGTRSRIQGLKAQPPTAPIPQKSASETTSTVRRCGLGMSHGTAAIEMSAALLTPAVRTTSAFLRPTRCTMTVLGSWSICAAHGTAKRSPMTLFDAPRRSA